MRSDAARTEVVAVGPCQTLALPKHKFQLIPQSVSEELALMIPEHNAKMMCILLLPRVRLCDSLKPHENFTFAFLLRSEVLVKGPNPNPNPNPDWRSFPPS